MYIYKVTYIVILHFLSLFVIQILKTCFSISVVSKYNVNSYSGYLSRYLSLYIQSLSLGGNVKYSSRSVEQQGNIL